MIFKRISIFCLEGARKRNYDAETKVLLRKHQRASTSSEGGMSKDIREHLRRGE
jgi:hypothetical protein